MRVDSVPLPYAKGDRVRVLCRLDHSRALHAYVRKARLEALHSDVGQGASEITMFGNPRLRFVARGTSTGWRIG
jgi:hypothetical protein